MQDNNELFIQVVLQEAILLNLNISLFDKKEKKKKKKSTKIIKATLRSFHKKTLPWGQCIDGTISTIWLIEYDQAQCLVEV